VPTVDRAAEFRRAVVPVDIDLEDYV
jgi:hypothetical protein